MVKSIAHQTCTCIYMLFYGPVYGFWCFPFECFTRILGSFQKNWVSPELQMFLTYQYLLFSNVAYLNSFVNFSSFNLVYMATSVFVRDQLSSLIYIHYLSLSTFFALPSIASDDTTLRHFYIAHRRYENIFDHQEVSWLTQVYNVLYPHETFSHVPMFHETLI